MCVMIAFKIYSLNNFQVYNAVLLIILIMLCIGTSQLALVVKNLPASVTDMKNTGSTSGSGRSPGKGNGNPLQYFCLENPMDRGVWQVTVHGVPRSQTSLKCIASHMQYINSSDLFYLIAGCSYALNNSPFPPHFSPW